MFKIICIFAVFFCATAAFANKPIISAETKSSESWVSQSHGDNTSKSDVLSVTQPSSKEHTTLQRLQLGIFPNRTAVDRVVVRLHRLDFETWIIPFKDGYVVSIGAFLLRSNLEQAAKRLTAAGFTNKIQVIEVDQKAQTIRPTQMTRSTLFDARGSQNHKAGVPRKKYEKLEHEVELLKSQMQLLINEKPPSKPLPTPADKPVDQTSTEPSETETVVDSPDESTAPPNDNDDAHAEEDESLAEGSRKVEAEDAKRQMDMFLREQTVLFKRGELEMEFGLNYSQDTAVATCFNPDSTAGPCSSGSQVTPKLSTRSVDASLGVTYGIVDDLALSLSLPYSYNELESDFTGFNVARKVIHNDHLGIGDVSGSLRYTARHEKGSIPGITLNVNAKSPTGNDNKRLGTGFWNVGAGVSLIKTFDPVVFFGSVGYTAALQKGGVNPGDQISYSFGGGFSLNDRVSVSTAFSGSAVLRTEVNRSAPSGSTDIASGKIAIPGSAQNINSLQFSSTIKISKALFVEPFVAFGLTRESGDFTVGIRVPYRFGDRFPLPFVHN